MITVPRWLLVVLVVAAAGSLLALSYLIGRESGREVAVGAPVAARRAATLPPATVAPAERVGAPAFPTVPELPETRPESPAPAATSQGVPPASEAAAPRRGPSPGVEAYFQRLDQIQIQGASASPDAAQAMLNAMLQGDSSEFDRLLGDAERAEREARAIAPPPECSAYHAALLEMLRDSRGLLADLKAAVGVGDSGALTSLGAKATDMQRRGEQLKEQERALRGT